MIYINITNFVLFSELEKDHSMIEICRLKNLLLLSHNSKFYAVKKNYKYLQQYCMEI